MKRVVALLFIVVIACTANAQMQVGVRTGVSYWPDLKLPYSALPASDYSWDNEIFTRYEMKKHWAFEYRLSYYSRRSSEEMNWLEFSGQYSSPYRANYTDYHADNGLSFQYNFTKHNKRIKNFAALNISLSAVKRYSVYYWLDNNLQTVSGGSYTDYTALDVLVGAGYYLSYAATENLMVNGAIQYDVNTSSFSSFSPATRGEWYTGSKVGVKFGIGYSFK